MTDSIERYKGTALVKYGAASTAILDERHITGCLKQLDIPDAEIGGYKTGLVKSQSEDKSQQEKAQQTAIVEWKERTNWLKRIFKKKPEVELAISPKTKLLETIVQTADSLEAGLKTYQSLPDVISRIKKDYAGLCARRDELYEQLLEFREFIDTGAAGTEALALKLRRYPVMNDDERKALTEELQGCMKHADKLKLDNGDVRDAICTAIEDECAGRKEQIAVMLFPMARDSYVSVLGQIKSTETQLERIRASVVPAFLSFNKQRELYRTLTRYTDNSEVEIGLAKMVAKAVELNKSAQDAVQERERELDVAKAMAEDIGQVGESLFGTYKPTGDLQDVKKEIDRLITMDKQDGQTEEVIVEIESAQREASR